MKALELLAPARNADIGIAAIDCGADAVYIAAEEFGARKAAGNSIEDVGRLCRHAHKFGARVFLTVNTIIEDGELERAHDTMLKAQEAGVDAFIIRDPRICGWKDITAALHASTQCAIRDVQSARYYESAGCSRIILERELSLETIREICRSVSCEVEFFVHGALCVCYSGDCRLSEYIGGRSADKGDCMQACRSLYDLVDAEGKAIVKNKALLSLKDYNLKNRIEELAEAGVSSFKIEGRLKNASYVKNVVRDYDIAINGLIGKHPGKYCRASFGRISGGFTPDTSKTFNRGYTELFLDGVRGKWSSMDTPKSMGEIIGTIKEVRALDKYSIGISLIPAKKNLSLKNGDGFSFVSEDGIVGFRGDVCTGNDIVCKNTVQNLRPGLTLYRNVSSSFEKELETNLPHRDIPVKVDISIEDGFRLGVRAMSQDGRTFAKNYDVEADRAINGERMLQMIESQISKRSGHYLFETNGVGIHTSGHCLPLLQASFINGIRREISEHLDCSPCNFIKLPEGHRSDTAAILPEKNRLELMRSRYCIRYELDICPKFQGAAASGPLFLVNNGRRFALGFDCAHCEMTVTPAQK